MRSFINIICVPFVKPNCIEVVNQTAIQNQNVDTRTTTHLQRKSFFYSRINNNHENKYMYDKL